MLGDAVLMGAAVGSILSVRYFHNTSTLLPNWVGKKTINQQDCTKGDQGW